MGDHIRTVKTASGATALQIVRYEKGKTIVISHIGSAHTEEDLKVLKQDAIRQIEKTTLQKSLFPTEKQKSSPILVINKSQYLGVRYSLIYEALSSVFRLFKFDRINNQLLLDLVIMRIIQPVSKLESLEYLSSMFGIKYKEGSLYQAIAQFTEFKDIIQKNTVAVAKKHFSFDFNIVFYDVTTLYFETFKEDSDKTDSTGAVILKGLRKNGFSKDNKSNQPQIVIGLIVTKEGFPVGYDVFEGNTFEGKTFIPMITKFKNAHKVKTLTIVADAAMISYDNVQELLKAELSYIVGARMASLKPTQIQTINADLLGKTDNFTELNLAKRNKGEIDLLELTEKDGVSIRVQTDRGLLVCDFSIKRYRKDKWEMEKQIARAKKQLLEKDGIKRRKFLKNKDDLKTEQILNTDLIEKTGLLLGIKGYYTNLEKVDNKTIIDHYHNLWRVELAFRIAKSDLQARPIFHHKRQTIEAHILICFMSLAVCKYMELKTDKSTKRIIKLLKSITDARIRNLLTGEVIVMRQELPPDIEQLWKTLSQSH